MDALYQLLTDITFILKRNGLNEAVLSPGSRSAPIALSFIRNTSFTCHTLVDERSAAYFALGRAKASKKPVVLVCTSGTAALNYAPAIAEAYFQHIPLLVITADRPAEWINQNDNQAINQQNLYGPHVLKSYQFPADITNESAQKHAWRQANDAVWQMNYHKGPVHINIPIREPFYTESTAFSPSENLPNFRIDKKIQQTYFEPQVFEELHKYKNVWLVIGMNSNLSAADIKNYCAAHQVLPVIDPLARAFAEFPALSYDAWLGQMPTPDLVLCEGTHFVSKTLKTYLRSKQVPVWNFGETRELIDLFGGLEQQFTQSLSDFIGQIMQIHTSKGWENKLLLKAQELEQNYRKTQVLDREYEMAKAVFNALPPLTCLHLGNSTPARYPLKLGHLLESKNISIYANRGTSGIDGCVSTAVGMAHSCDKIHVLLIGDLAIRYDRNGLWMNNIPKNLHIIVINNNGGGIFRRIEGPAKQPELDSYFCATQKHNFKFTALEAGFKYQNVLKVEELVNLSFDDSKPLFIEIVVE